MRLPEMFACSNVAHRAKDVQCAKTGEMRFAVYSSIDCILCSLFVMSLTSRAVCAVIALPRSTFAITSRIISPYSGRPRGLVFARLMDGRGGF